MTQPLTVAILAGGLTHEREVSMHSGRRVAAVLREAGVQVKLLDVDSTLLQRLESMSPDVVWPLVHGSTGEDGSLQNLLELVGVPYVGSDPMGCRLASDKAVASSILGKAGLQVPDSVDIPQALFRDVGVNPMLDLLGERFGFPLVVKPSQGGSGLGVTIVESAAQLPRAMVDCFAYGENAHIEQYVSGREVAVAVIDVADGDAEGPQALPAVEIVTDGLYDYDARYNAGRVEYFVPARLSDDDARTVGGAAETVHSTLGLRDYSRTDIIFDGETPWILDVNVAPGMTETSLFPQAVAAAAKQEGTTVDSFYLRILETAAKRI
ncbi:D-alanine--D-alanine ligase [Actinobaculum sp. 352]|uniref:D-alanine--D-alanine ligase family protein n=1 Tax=Actinobaculum sp. 352 TaxID=2490946 RepID=UPI000F7DD994|nr:D-alanine--D-alanine ligase [Actinobaculum sp. 352]RTE49772.1 D-alanine--D-alanine ligase [Actinobaculum sp. 352]